MVNIEQTTEESFYDRYSRLAKYVENTLNFKVINFSDQLPNDIAGRIFYIEREIHLNCPSAESGLYTLLHEAGHAYSYRKYWIKLKQKQPTPEQREIYAYLYGWGLNKSLNLNIDKDSWRKDNL